MTNDPASMSATLIDPATKEWIQLALDALTAFGTVGAVIVALWLAGRGRVEIIRGRAGERLIIQMGMRADEGTPIINIEVTKPDAQICDHQQYRMEGGHISPSAFRPNS